MDQVKGEFYESYYANNKDNLENKIKERINWILNSVEGNDILDIGCSQGITSILLARKGKKVVGVDSLTAIETSKKNLMLEERIVQDLVSFKADFDLTNFSKKFDYVILNNGLEGFNIKPEDIINHISPLIIDHGKLIIISPLVFNKSDINREINFFLNLQTDEVQVENVHFFKEEIGIIYGRKSRIRNGTNSLILQLEKNVLDNHKLLMNQITNSVNSLDKKLNNFVEGKNTAILNNDNNNYKERYLEEKIEKIKIQNELLSQYNVEEKLLERQRELNKEKELLIQRYNNLRNSTLGKLTTKYWRWRNRRSRK